MSQYGRRGWVIVASTFMTLTVTYGAWYSYSVFLVALIREFGWSRALVSGAFSLFVLVGGGLGPLTGWLAWRVGPRPLILVGGVVMSLGLALAGQISAWWHLYAAFGVVTSVGISLAGWVTSVVLIQGWFPSQFATAMGLASAGVGAGMFTMIPLAEFCIGRWGWQWAFRFEAIVILAWAFPAAYWLVSDPPGSGASRATTSQTMEAGLGKPHWTLAAAFRTWRFWGVGGVFFLGNFVTQMLLIHQVAYLVDQGVPAGTAAVVGGLAGLISIPAKAGWGRLSDRIGREITSTLAFTCVSLSIGALVVAGRHPHSALPYLYALLLGPGYAVLSAVFPAIVNDLFAGPGFSMIYGTLYVPLCLALALGPWLAGRIFDLTGSYATALWLGLGAAILTPILVWIVAPRRPNPVPADRQ